MLGQDWVKYNAEIYMSRPYIFMPGKPFDAESPGSQDTKGNSPLKWLPWGSRHLPGPEEVLPLSYKVPLGDPVTPSHALPTHPSQGQAPLVEHTMSVFILAIHVPLSCRNSPVGGCRQADCAFMPGRRRRFLQEDTAKENSSARECYLGISYLILQLVHKDLDFILKLQGFNWDHGETG